MTETPEFSSTLPERYMIMELFTEYHRIAGKITTNALRTYGVLNTSEEHLVLGKVSTSSLIRPQDAPIESGEARISKHSIVLAVPNEDPDNEQRLMAARIFNRGELLQRRVMLVLGNYELSGNLHLDQELDLQRVLIERPENYIGVTNASIVYLPNPSLKFAASTVLINKNRVDFVCAGAP